MTKSEGAEIKEYDLRENNFVGKKTKAYDLNDEEIQRIVMENDIVIKLISNDKGVFIDIRKHYKGYPTKKGIRFAAARLFNIYNLLKDDIKEHIPHLNK